MHFRRRFLWSSFEYYIDCLPYVGVHFKICDWRRFTNRLRQDINVSHFNWHACKMSCLDWDWPNREGSGFGVQGQFNNMPIFKSEFHLLGRHSLYTIRPLICGGSRALVEQSSCWCTNGSIYRQFQGQTWSAMKLYFTRTRLTLFKQWKQ